MSDPLLSGPDPAFGAEPGELVRRSGRMLNELSRAQLIGAGNLLTKALGALAAGDEERAEKLIGRAAEMPYDERELTFPGATAALMLIYDTINDEFDASERDDSTWLDVVIAVHPGLDPMGRVAVASVVHGFVLQEPLFSLSETEKRRIRSAFGGAPLDPDLGNVPSTSAEALRALIRSLVTAALALDDAYVAAERSE